jgi:MYXO-CTERM domain-containing protein
MLIHRLTACFIVATSIAAAAEAHASCSDPAACICASAADISVTFAGTIVESAPSSAQFKVRLDSLSPVGPTTKLAVGDVVPFDVEGAPGKVFTGARVLGFATRDCADGGQDCAPETRKETTDLQQIAAMGSSFVCGATPLPVSAESLATTMASGDCRSQIFKMLDDAGIDTACHDTGPCSARPGPASSGGWAFLLGIAALIGVRRARR